VEFVDVPDAVAEQGMQQAGLPPMMAEAIVAVFGSYRRGSQERVTSTVERLTGHRPRHFAEFAREYASVFSATNGSVIKMAPAAEARS
jgi:hypothetical protein